MAEALRVVLVKPSKYAPDGCVERFRWGFMPNSTLAHMRSLTPPSVDGAATEVTAIDEYVQTDLAYLDLLRADPSRRTLLALVGVQSHQFHRALDLAALARSRGIESCVIGGPHPNVGASEPGAGCAARDAAAVLPQVLLGSARGGADCAATGCRRRCWRSPATRSCRAWRSGAAITRWRAARGAFGSYRAADYTDLRRRTYGIDRVELPASCA